MNPKTSEKRVVDGILLLNKPPQLTSNAVLQQMKRLFCAKKAGHTGSLDPLATGMLPICFGQATKWCQYLLDADKCYEVTGLLGIKTDTSDSTGTVIARADSVVVSEENLRAVLSTFMGTTSQTPSMFSALKYQGTPLYHLARAGIEVERQAREITIYDLVLNDFDGLFFKLTVLCSKGTYIRNLVEDIGERLGVGAHVTQLHRLFTAGLSEEPMFTVTELADKHPDELLTCLLPMERAVSHLPVYRVNELEEQALRCGKLVESMTSSLPGGLLQLFRANDVFIGLGEVSDSGVLKVKRLVA
jgi:tRNA pseudouridine55 synthase